MAAMKQASVAGRHDIAGIIVLMIGAGILALGSGIAPHLLEGSNAPVWVLLASGALFALPGLMLLSQGRLPAWVRTLLGNCLLTLFAVIPAWVAWGGDSRAFSGSGGLTGLIPGLSFVGFARLAFALAALVMGLVALFAWIAWIKRLGRTGRAGLLAGAFLAAWLLLRVMPAEPRWPDSVDDHERLARYALMVEDEGWGRIGGRHPRRWYYPPWRNIEQWTKAARSRLAAVRALPAGQAALLVPRIATAPEIDGAIGEAEWRGALRIALVPEALGSSVRAASDGRRLYLAAEVPADTTTDGFDQFRVWFHIGLSPWLANERALVDRSGGINVLRATRFPWGDNPPRSRTDWHIHEKAAGASSLDGHRRFELALDLDEAGIVPGVAFPLWLEIEGDPVRDANRKFRARSNLGQAGSYDAPLWFRVAAD
ncbi:MAG: hypothetical protein ABIG36_00990 [Pseudomonadota bacterium]